MARSFVLKDRMGTAAGYLMQGAGTIRCRVAGTKERMQAILLDEHGGFYEHEIAPGGGEHTWKDEGKEITGAAIVYGGEIFVQSSREVGERARAIVAGVKKKPPEVQKSKTQEKREHTEQNQMEKQNEETIALPQRRWPPPPCMRQAVYRHGAWRQESH